MVAGSVLASIPIFTYVFLGLPDSGKSAHAANTTLSIDITFNTPIATVDKNDPDTVGPFVATIWGKVTNSGTGDAINVTATLGSLTNGLAFHTGQQATYTIPTVPTGDSEAFSWPITYSRTDGTVVSYTITGDPSNSEAVLSSGSLTSTEIGSAASNKIENITASATKVAVGETITVTPEFNLGQIGNKFEDAWLQLVGNTDFDPSIPRLFSAQATLNSVAQSGDDLYFTGLSGGVTDDVLYIFRGVSTGTTTTKPYQQGTSGAIQKYADDFGGLPISVEGTPFEGNVGLAVSPTTGVKAGSTLTYTMSVGNTGGQAYGDPSSGNNTVVTADIPSNTTYVAGSVVDTPDFKVQWSTDNESTWVDAEPPASAVTDVRWILTSAVPPNTATAVTDTLEATVNPCVSDGTTITNKAFIGVGSATGLDSATASATTGISDTNLKILKSDSAGPVLAGNNLTHTFTVSNEGPCDTTGVTVTDPSRGANSISASTTVYPTALMYTNIMGNTLLAASNPSVVTDKEDYQGGETVVITGTGFNPGAQLTVTVTWPPSDGRVDSASVIATGDAGVFTFNYQLGMDAVNGQYNVDVLDASGTVLASTSFVDSHFFYAHITSVAAAATR